MSWQPLCDSNPIPGDPAGVATLSGDLGRVAADIEEQASTLQRVNASDFWEGDAAEEFKKHQGKLPGLLSQLSTRYENVSNALGAYHPELHEAQLKAYEALIKAREAERAIAEAEAGVRQMEDWNARAQCMADDFNAQRPDQPAQPPAQWSGPNYPAMLCEAEADLAEARRLLECAIEIYERAARACAERIACAIDDGLKNDTGFSAWLKRQGLKVLDALPLKGLAQYYEILAAAFAVIGAVLLALSLIFPPLLAISAAFFKASTAATGVKLLIDLALIARGDGSWDDVKGDVIGLATFGLGKIAKLAKLAKTEHAIDYLGSLQGAWTIGSKIGKLLAPEPETRPRCELVPRPCIYRPPPCPPPIPKPKADEGMPTPIPIPRDCGVVHRVVPGRVAQPTDAPEPVSAGAGGSW